jgi:hypothetical protein
MSTINAIIQMLNEELSIGTFYMEKLNNRQIRINYAGMPWTGATLTKDAAETRKQIERAFRRNGDTTMGFQVLAIDFIARRIILRTFSFRTGW